MRFIFLAFSLTICSFVNANIEYRYKGSIGKYNITLTIFGPISQIQAKDISLPEEKSNIEKLNIASNQRAKFVNNIHGYYYYDKYKSPILLRGTWGDRGFTFNELDPQDNISARFWFEDFSISEEVIAGHWIQEDTELPVKIMLNSYSVPQKTLVGRYEILLISSGGETSINIYTDKDTKLMQVYDKLDCSEQLFDSPTNIKVDDYNFDGHPDFSVTCSQFTSGTGHFFMLFDPKIQEFVPTKEVSEFSLDKAKQILVLHEYCNYGERRKFYRWDEFYFDEEAPVEDSCLSYGPAEKQKNISIENCGC